MTELEEYKELVECKANESSPEILPNAGAEHAAIAFSKLFDNTNNSVNMIVDNLNGKVSNQTSYIESLEKAIKKNIEFKIGFFENPNPESEAYKLLKNRNNTKIKCFKISDVWKNKLIIKGKKINFTIFDNDKYRIETDTEKYIGFLCFNDKINATRWLQVYNRLYEDSKDNVII